MKNRIRVLFIILSVSIATVKGQVEKEACYESLIDYLQTVEESAKNQANKVQYCRYTIKNITREKNASLPEAVDIEMKSSGDKVLLHTSVMDIYVDKEKTLLVYPVKKLVIVSDTPDNPDKLSEQRSIVGMQKAIIDSCVFKACRMVSQSGVDYRMLEFEASEVLKDKGIAQLTYYLNDKSGNLDRMIISYDERSTLRRQEYLFLEVNYDYKKEKIKPIERYVFNESGKLLDKYEGFQIVDNSNSPNQ